MRYDTSQAAGEWIDLLLALKRWVEPQCNGNGSLVPKYCRYFIVNSVNKTRILLSSSTIALGIQDCKALGAALAPAGFLGICPCWKK